MCTDARWNNKEDEVSKVRWIVVVKSRHVKSNQICDYDSVGWKA